MDKNDFERLHKNGFKNLKFGPGEVPPNAIQNANGTWRYFGVMQWQMNADAQRRAGLLARSELNVGIHPCRVLKARKPRKQPANDAGVVAEAA